MASWDYSLYNNQIINKINLYDYVDCIYYICADGDYDPTYFDSLISNSNLSKVINIKYNINHKFNDLCYFKHEAVYRAILDANIFNFDKILIIPDSVNFISSDKIEYILNNYNTADINILNPGDINEDCYILNKKAIKYIVAQHPDFTNIKWFTNIKNNCDKNLTIQKSEYPICLHKIDYVVTYVNAEDPIWQSQYKESVRSKSEENRFRDWGTLPFHFRGIAQHMPWINNVYLVVSYESQVPDWINRDKVKIVLHKDIIPEDLLPTFNSCVIESYLPFIKGLSEYWLYANDDMFVLNDVFPTDFYENGKIKCEFKNIPNKTSIYNKQCINSFKVVMNDFSLEHINIIKSVDSKYKKLFHTIHPYLKSTGLHLHKLYNKNIYKSSTQFRTSSNINQYIFGLYEYLQNNYINKTIKTAYNNLSVVNYLYALPSCDTLCLNDNNVVYVDYNDTENTIHNLLYYKLDTCSKYEKYESIKNVVNNTFAMHIKSSIQKSNIHVKTAICAIAKNENHYIREWVEHHRKLGFDKIYLYDNNDVNGEHFEDVINDYILSGYVKVINYRGIWPSQIKAYNEFYQSDESKKYEWILYIDIDEFFELENKNLNVSDLVGNDIYKDYDAIKICWKYYDDNNLVTVENNNYSVTRFTHHNNDPIMNGQTKQLIRTNLDITINSPHGSINRNSKDEHLYSIIKACDIFGIHNVKNNIWILNDTAGGIHHIAWINHYRFKTIEEYIIKSYRGWATTYQNGGHSYMGLKFFNRFNQESDEKNKLFNKLFIPYTYNSCTDDNKIIISFTSYPQRIHCVKHVLDSLVYQSVNNNLYHIVLCLSLEEFPSKEYNLPKDLVNYIQKHKYLIEIIWTEYNTRSHKKLMPTLQKYPNNYILIVDDDICRPKLWLSKFIESKEKYPNDIIVGTCKTKINKNLKNVLIKFKYHENGHGHYGLDEENKVLTTERPANGYGGTLYPPHTFTNSDFFKMDLYMKLSPSSDEMWQYCFNIMDNKTFRTLSYFYDYETYVIKESQKTALWKENNDKYTEIYKTLFKYFPQFKINIMNRINNE